jgi:sugar transferase (PEP-CTERM/EpsH1 system associated)
MEEVLYLTHRIPFPPDKGDKIRSFNILRYLANRYQVHLGTFSDNPSDQVHVPAVRKYCGEVCIERIHPPLARVASLRGLLNGQALSIPYYSSSTLKRWVSAILEQRTVSAVVVYSSPMAQYVMGPEYRRFRRIMDFVDVDSDKWRQYADKRRGLSHWIYRRESQSLLDFERTVTNEFDAVTFVSENECKLFGRLNPESKAKHFPMHNGVDSSYFDCEIKFDSPYGAGVKPVVFTGMMDYWPNVDAVQWFARNILPEVKCHEPQAEFWIVGSSPTKAVRDLGGLPGVHITGRVPDVRPYLKNAAVAVAPLRVARGVQNKVLEALAIGCNVICSDEALAGLQCAYESPAVRATSQSEFAAEVLSILRQGSKQSQKDGPAYVRQHYDWDRNMELLGQLLAPEAAK